MNHPSVSKINYTALIIQIITIAVLTDLIPAKFEASLIAIAGIVLPTFVQIFRTWFTEKE